ncbi:MAG: SpoIIE family protein phosphatase [Anaerolineae bacterium]|nr:SpoIIE family protein phosphatase [Anaerolineae bacterium]
MDTQAGKDPMITPQSRKKRLTFGLMARRLIYPWALAQLQGMVDACRERDVNLIYFAGGVVYDPNGFELQHNILYDMASIAELDGIIISTSTVTEPIPDGEPIKDFLKRFRPRPIVAIERPIEGVPTILKSEYESMAEVMTHLIEVHGYRRIVYVNRVGPRPHRDRYRAYVDSLARYGIPFNPNLVFSAAISQHRFEPLRPGIDFEAVVAADDDCGLAAMRRLQARGVQVPEDVAVTGFDNVAESWAVTPPFTTVSSPFHQLGSTAVEMLFSLLEGKDVPEEVVLPCKLLVRQSCGCMPAEVSRTALWSDSAFIAPLKGPSKTGPEALDAVIAAHRDAILSEMRQALGTNPANSDGLESLLDSFLAEVAGQSVEIFLRKLNKIVSRPNARSTEAQLWQDALTVLRRWVLPCLDEAMFARADDLWHQGRVLVGAVMERAQAFQAFQAEKQARVLREIGHELITTFRVDRLMEILAKGLPRLGFPSCYVALYETSQPYQYPQEDLGLSKLMLAYNEQGRITPEPDQPCFPTGKLLPDGLWPDRQFAFVAEALYFQENQIGFTLLEMGPRLGTPYEALRGQVSSALEGALLMAKEEKHTRQLQTVAEVTMTTSTILDMAELLQRVVDMTKSRFGLYHAHIYLLNEAGDLLVSAAGAGQVGRQMVAENWHVPLDAERSLVARTARLRKEGIIGNVQASPYWLPNSLLPDAQSELAVPLIAGDVVLGVLDVQSAEANAFTDNDVRIQSTLAGQIAAALQNVKLFEQITLANAEIQTLNEQLKKENLRMMAELDVSRRLQQMLLPSDNELRQVRNLDVAGFMEPAEEVGGDYYDVLQHKEHVKFGIGDVTGHGLESGVLMLMLQTAVRTLLTSEENDPVRFMDVLNQTLYKNLQRMDVEKNLTLALIDYAVAPDTQKGQMRLFGQHEQVIVVRKDARIELMDTLDLGVPLALMSGIAEFVKETPISLDPGDGIVLYSDGITEAENEVGQYYGLERLCTILSRNWTKPAAEIKQAVVTDIRQFIGRQQVFDDLTLLIVKQL